MAEPDPSPDRQAEARRIANELWPIVKEHADDEHEDSRARRIGSIAFLAQRIGGIRARARRDRPPWRPGRSRGESGIRAGAGGDLPYVRIGRYRRFRRESAETISSGHEIRMGPKSRR